MSKFARIFVGFLFVFLMAQTIFGVTYTVTKIADTNDGACDADCSLREAVAAANGTTDNDIIDFSTLFSTAQTIVLSGSEIVIANNGSLTINGPGADKLTIDGNNTSRIMATGANVVFNLNNVKLTRGNGVGAVNSGRGGAFYNVGGTTVITNTIMTANSAANGGALNNAASTSPSVPANLTLINCVLSNNSSTSSGAAMQNFSTSTLNMISTTVSGNMTSSTGIAGAFQANGMVTITNSTFSGNTAAGTGGAIYYNGTGLTMNNTTFANNTSALGAGGFHKATTMLNANVRNTIMANNTGAAATPDVAGAISSQGNNLIGNVGTSTGWVASDLQNMNALLAPLGFYGGFSPTHALLSGSPALDAGQNCVTDLSCSAANPPVALTTDQRGATRPFNTTVDIGAFEANSSFIAILPNAEVNQPYNFTLASNFTGFTFLLSGGSLGGLTLTSNANTAFISGAPAQAGVFDATVQVTNGANIATINYRITVIGPAANVSVGGRVLSPQGYGVSRAIVAISNQSGVIQTATTNNFGVFNFTGIQTGQTYTINVLSKQYQFAPLNVPVNGEITDLMITAGSKN